jgi:hypothetical protein
VAYSHKHLRDYLPRFLREYQRTSRRPGMDPNDRHYDRAFEQRLKRLPPEELDQLINGVEDDNG